MKYKNTILLKPPKKIPFILKTALVIIPIIFSIWCLNYFILDNDLVNFPYFPSTFLSNANFIISWFIAICICVAFLNFFMLISYAWIRGYQKQKLTRYGLITFLWITGLCLGIFFGYASKKIVYISINAICSQLALHIGQPTEKQGEIFENHSLNLLFKHKIKVTRGKTTVDIIDPVSYKFNIEFALNGQNHHLNQYCYSGSEHEPILRKSVFNILGMQSFLGFRCTSGCQLHQYFKLNNPMSLSQSNFTACKSIYSNQPALK